MDNKYSVEDILKELENKKTQTSAQDQDLSKIMSDILGKEYKPVEIPKISFDPQSEKQASKNDQPKIEVVPSEESNSSKNDKIVLKEAQSLHRPAVEQTVSFDEKEIREIKSKKADFKVKIDYDKADEPIQEDNVKVKPAFEDQTIQMEPFGITQNIEIEKEEVVINKELAEFKENRKKKVEKFVLFGDSEEDNDPEIEEFVQPENDSVKTIEDFNDYSEATAIIKDLSGIKASLTLRLIVLSILTFVSAYVELGNRFSIPMLEIMNRSTQPLSYLIISALIFVAAALVTLPAIFSGFTSLFKAKADSDSLLFVSFLGSFVQYLALFISPMYISGAKNTVCIYSFISILAMLLNTYGKLLIIKRVRLNFRFVSGGYEKYAITMPENEKINTFIKEQFKASYTALSVPKRTDFIGNFLSYSFREDLSDNVSKIISPIISIGALILSVVSFIFVKDAQKAATTFAAITAISAPISAMICINLPFLSATKKLISRGCMISGLSACNEIYDTNSVLVKTSDLFPKGSIQLSAIKTFAAGKIDDVILDAASVVIKAESDLADVFLSVIGGRRDMLKNVDSIIYEESMGLSAWVDSKRVLIGNRDLISNHGIDVPSKDYEARYLDGGMDMVYLAESGELAAVFLIQYKPGKQIKRAMKALKELGIGVVAVSTDPNINAKKIAKIFDVDEGMIKTVPADKQGESEKLMRPSSRENVGTASISSFTAFVQTIYASIKLKGSASLAVTLQTVGTLLGFAIMAFFTVMSGSISIGVEAILLYQIFWLFVVCVVPALKKIKI